MTDGVLWITPNPRKKDLAKSLRVRYPLKIARPLKIKSVYLPDSLSNKSENSNLPTPPLPAPTASTPLSEKGRIRFPGAVVVTNQRPCFLPQWYPKFHQEHRKLLLLQFSFHLSSPWHTCEGSPNAVSYQLLKTADTANVWNLLMSQPCTGLQPAKAWLEFHDAQWRHPGWVRAEPLVDSSEIRQTKPCQRDVWRGHLGSPYSLPPNLQRETPSSPLILPPRAINLGNCSFHPPYSHFLMKFLQSLGFKEKIFYLL